MRLFIPREFNHQDIDPHFLNSNINTSHSSSSNMNTSSKSEFPDPYHATSLESNDFFIPLIFLLLCLMENEENK